MAEKTSFSDFYLSAQFKTTMQIRLKIIFRISATRLTPSQRIKKNVLNSKINFKWKFRFKMKTWIIHRNILNKRNTRFWQPCFLYFIESHSMGFMAVQIMLSIVDFVITDWNRNIVAFCEATLQKNGLYLVIKILGYCKKRRSRSTNF